MDQGSEERNETLAELLDHLDFLRALTRGLTENADDADDLQQDVLVQALERAPSGLRNTSAWLRVVAANMSRNRRRASARRRAREARVARLDEESTGDIAERRKMVGTLLSSLENLDPLNRKVLLLRFDSGLPPREIARRLDLPVEATKGRLKRALAQVRQRLEAVHGSGATTRCALLLALNPLGPGTAEATRRSGSRFLAQLTVSSLVRIAGLVVLVGGVTFYFATGQGRRDAGDSLTPGSTVTDAGDVAPTSPTAPSDGTSGTRSTVPAPAGTTVELYYTHGTLIQNNFIGTSPDGTSIGNRASTAGVAV